MRKIVNIFKQIFASKKDLNRSQKKHQPVIIPRESHKISRRHISKAALKVLYRLRQSGYSAYLVGGSVRDLLLGHIPNDFDVVTDARPEKIKRLFRNSYIIGRRFRLVHVHFEDEIIEVATFRGNTQETEGRIQTQKGLLLRDNVYGTIEDDVWRRDFTINALYYNIADFTVIDYTGGMEDLKQKKIHVIGDPEERYIEDPARMLRAIRLAAKLDFQVEENSAKPIRKHQELLKQVPSARLFDKILKIFHSGKSLSTFHLLQEYKVFPILFPKVAKAIQEQPSFKEFVEAAFKNTDDRIKKDKSINSAFLFAVLFWCPLQQQQKIYLQKEECKEPQAVHLAMGDILDEELKIIAIPRKFTTVMREIWYLQYYLENARAKRVYKILHLPRFRAAYDFFGLRCETTDAHLIDIFHWWTEFQAGDEQTREKLVQTRFKAKHRKRKKKRAKSDQGIHSAGE